MYDGRFELGFFTKELTLSDLEDIKLGRELSDVKFAWKDFGLIPTTRPSIASPTVKTNMVDVPGANGTVDLSEAVTGYPLYGNRSGSLEFVCETTNDPQSLDYWIKRKSDLMTYLHGKKLKMIVIPECYTRPYYHEGRFELAEWKNEESRSSVKINYELYPYKKYLEQKELDVIIWDDEGASVKLEAEEEPVAPLFSAQFSTNTDRAFVVVQTQDSEPQTAFSWKSGTILNTDGTYEEVGGDSYDSQVKTHEVCDKFKVSPGDLVICSGRVSSRHFKNPYLVAYDSDGNVVTYLLASLYGTAETTVNAYTRLVPRTLFYVPKGVSEIALCFEDIGHAESSYSGNPHYLPAGEETYFSDIVLNGDMNLYFKILPGSSATVAIRYRNGVLG